VSPDKTVTSARVRHDPRQAVVRARRGASRAACGIDFAPHDAAIQELRQQAFYG